MLNVRFGAGRKGGEGRKGGKMMEMMGMMGMMEMRGFLTKEMNPNLSQMIKKLLTNSFLCLNKF